MKSLFILLTFIAFIFVSPFAVSADSAQIRRDFFALIENEHNFGRYNLDIEVIGGVLTARGDVSSEIAKSRIVEIAQSVAGVEKVINRVQVTGAAVIGTGSVSSSIAELIVQRARRDLKNENYTLNVVLEGQDVILKGTVDTVSGSRTLFRIAESVAPSYKVRNQLVVKEEALTDDELHGRVIQALKSDPQINIDDLHIRAESGVVYIAGSRPEHRSIDRILSTIIMVDGVKDVKSTVKIGAP